MASVKHARLLFSGGAITATEQRTFTRRACECLWSFMQRADILLHSQYLKLVAVRVLPESQNKSFRNTPSGALHRHKIPRHGTRPGRYSSTRGVSTCNLSKKGSSVACMKTLHHITIEGRSKTVSAFHTRGDGLAS